MRSRPLTARVHVTDDTAAAVYRMAIGRSIVQRDKLRVLLGTGMPKTSVSGQSLLRSSRGCPTTPSFAP